jgi:hypothetical protein
LVFLLRNYLVKHIIEGKIKGTGRGGMRCKQLPNDFKENEKILCYNTVLRFSLVLLKHFFFQEFLIDFWMLHNVPVSFFIIFSESAKLRKVSINFAIYVYPSIRTYGTFGRIFKKFNIWGFFENISRKFDFH